MKGGVVSQLEATFAVSGSCISVTGYRLVVKCPHENTWLVK